LSTVARYFHTVRYLRPIQIAGRAWFRMHRPRPQLRPADPERTAICRYASPIESEPTMLDAATFRFLNVTRSVATAPDWQASDASALWLYNLHYFDDLNARGAELRRDWHLGLMQRWVQENLPGRGIGWDPYPVSRRIVNWVKWSSRGESLPESCRESLAVQSRWLMRRLEYHLLGNHLFANAKALVHAGLHFEGAEPSRLLRRGLMIVDREVDEQVLEDGGHFERSPMYHAAFLEDLLDLVNLLRRFGQRIPATWLAAIERMRRWLQVMTHPDGEIAFFNDAAFGIAPTLEQLEAYAVRLSLGQQNPESAPLVPLRASGYVRAMSGAASLLCDCAPLGPDYLLGHAHSDTLSFELSLRNRRILVNSGTSVYGTSTERLRQRGTAAHTTVVVDGADSSEVWSGFRVARRARARLEKTSVSGNQVTVEASHDGYCRLPGRNLHHRRWQLDERTLIVQDRISGRFTRAEAYFHLHPELRAEVAGPMRVRLHGPDGLTAHLEFGEGAALDLREGTWHPRFGLSQPNQHICARFRAASLTTRLSW
jgi:uncharacterized heparinase superfamily protein